MEYVPSFMRFAKEEGLEQGLKQGIEQARELVLEALKMSLEIKFGKEGLSLLSPTISKLHSSEELIAFQTKLKSTKKIEDLQNWSVAS